jgi:ABC-type nitrate/sulfonate/bicarbonate transport system ATPase subunit
VLAGHWLLSDRNRWTRAAGLAAIGLACLGLGTFWGQEFPIIKILWSILRALITNPEVLFLDEPFSALDYEMTLFMREQLQRVFMKTKTTTLLVSHDLEEAVQLANRVLLLTRRPTRVADAVEIDLPWPRRTESVIDARFVELKSHCLAVFQREIVH